MGALPLISVRLKFLQPCISSDAEPPALPTSFLLLLFLLTHRAASSGAGCVIEVASPQLSGRNGNEVMLLPESGPKLHPDFYSSLGAEVRGDLWCLLSQSTEIRLVRCLTLTTCFSAVVDWV